MKLYGLDSAREHVHFIDAYCQWTPCHTSSIITMSATGDRLEFYYMVKFPTDRCLEYKDMIKIRAR